MSVPPLFLGLNTKVTDDTFNFGKSFATTSQTPVKNYDLTNKMYVDDTVNQQKIRIDTISSAIEIDFDKLKDLKDFLDSLPLESLTSIITEIGIKITTLKSGLEKEILDRQTAIQSVIDMVTLEYEDRGKSEAEINEKIDSFISIYSTYVLNNNIRSTDIETSVLDEASARELEDDNIKESIAVLKTKTENDILLAKTHAINRITELNDAEALARSNEDIKINAELIRIEGKLDTEITDRTNAVSNLQDQINNLDLSLVLEAIDTEISDRQAGDILLDGKITAEKDLREGADTAIRLEIQGERDSRIAEDRTIKDKIDAEVSNRSTADIDLLNKITTEQETRSIDDTALGNRITAEQNSRILVCQAITDSLNNEITLRTTEDTTLRDRISTEENTRLTNDTALGNRITTEVSARENADTAIENRITTEVSARENADTALDGRIDAEALTRLKEDESLGKKIDAEALTRETADTALGSQITNFVDELTSEATLRSEGITKLTTDLETETTNRINNDNTLQTAIETEVTNRTNKDNDLESQIKDLKKILDELKTNTTDKLLDHASKINYLYLTFYHRNMKDAVGVDANYQMMFQYGPGAL